MSNEIWKYIENTDEQYMISNLGRVMSMWRNNQHQTHIGKPHILKPSIHRQGYLWVRIKINGEFIKEYKSATEAEKECGYDSSYISMVCNERRPSAYGYKWHFKKKIDILIEAIADLLNPEIKDEDLE